MSQNHHSTQIQRCIDRQRAGDPAARNELLVRASARLTRLTRMMLLDFPVVHRWEETDDVLQNAVLRLSRALGEVPLPTAADFLRLATVQIRRELLDLARRYSGTRGLMASTLHSSRESQMPAGRASPPKYARSRSPGCLDRVPPRG
jgi:RNA polymerase sigma-70 factor (ECF subfamily)